jgi:hypothetical protein
MHVTLKYLRYIMKAHPFRPFWLCMADGRKLHVIHPDFIAVSPSGRAATVFIPNSHLEFVDLLLVTRITFRKTPYPRRSGKRRSA